MNKVYRVVWNVATASWSAVAETAKGRTKGARRAASVGAVAAAVLAVSMGTAAAAEACKTPDGRDGTLDEAGVCQAAQQPKVGAQPGVGATLDDKYFKVNSTKAAATATGTDSIAIGGAATAGGDGDVAIGSNTVTAGGNSTALGFQAKAMGSASTALGSYTQANGAGSVAIGHGAWGTGDNTAAVGRDAVASANQSVALGYQSVADRVNTVSVGSSDSSTGFTRQIVNVGAGTQANDAVNVSQLTPLVNSLGGGASFNSTTGAVTSPTYTLTNGGTQTTVGGALTGLDTALTQLNSQISGGTIGVVRQDATSGNITVGLGLAGSLVNFTGSAGPRVLKGIANGVDDSDAVTLAQLKAATSGPAALTYDDDEKLTATLGGSGGTTLKNVKAGLVASGSMDAVNGDQLYQLQQKFADRYNDMQSQINDIVAGGGSGVDSGTVNGNNGLAAGTGSSVTGDNGTAVGDNATVTANNGTAVGQGASVSGTNGTAIGQGASASGQNSTAIGSNSTATGNNSVAIGAGSMADRDNAVSMGSAGQERQVTNVAAGTAATDAVNVQQMNDAVRSAHRDAMGGISAAMAVAGLPQSTLPGRTLVGVAGSTYGGEVGTAIGASYMSRDGEWVIKGASNTSSRGVFGAVLGGGMYW